jgi:hypothetical protein
MNILVISDDENSTINKQINKKNVLPIIRRSIMSAMEVLKHHNIVAIIIDKEHQNVDTIELILNARDIVSKIPIFVPNEYLQKEDWSLISGLGQIRIYDEKKLPLIDEILP